MPDPAMLPTLLEVFRSPRSAECEERAFVLTAVGIPNVIDFDGFQYVIRVEASLAEPALEHLERYAAESRPAPPPPPPPRLNPFAWVGAAFYIVVLLVVGLSVSGGLWRLDAFDLGAIDAARVKSGEWWRAITALTLHVNGEHLAANLAGGVWFAYLAARQLGSGVTWLLTVLGAGLANLLESLLGPATHQSVGASTAVFTALGILAAYSWRTRFSYPQRWARRWAPIVAGVLLLGWLGSEGEHTDVVAHVAGFVVGTSLGTLVAIPRVRRALTAVPQWVTGGAALALVAIAWTLALMS
jgi:membrane associated rhomboid family serine protease